MHGKDIFCSKETEMLQTQSLWRNYCGRHWTSEHNKCRVQLKALHPGQCNTGDQWSIKAALLCLWTLAFSLVQGTVNFVLLHLTQVTVHSECSIFPFLCTDTMSVWSCPVYCSWEIFTDTAASDGVKNKVHGRSDQTYVRPELTWTLFYLT